MPENKFKIETKELLGSILSKTFNVSKENPFEDLIKKIDDDVKPTLHHLLDESVDKVTQLLHSKANSSESE